MTEIFVDIENTLIDDLSGCNLLQEQTERIAEFIRAKISLHHYDPTTRVNLFTWGWKCKDEIRDYLVEWLFNAMEVPPENRGVVWTKDDSIECAYTHGWVNTRDELEIEDIRVEGSSKRYGLDKRMCFIQQVMDLSGFPSKDSSGEFFLVDDTNNRWDEVRALSTPAGASITIAFLHPDCL